MTPEKAAEAYRHMRDELEQRATDARPVLKSFEVHLLFEKSRASVKAVMRNAKTFEDIYAAAREPFLRLTYVRGSKFAP